jgi:hypothetical protein
MKCACVEHHLDFLALKNGRLPIKSRFRLGRHVRGCLSCRLMLLILAEYAEKMTGPGARDIKALATMTDVDANQMAGWLTAMFGQT